MQSQYKPIRIEWVDSEADPGWKYIPTIEPHESHIDSIGFLLKETDTAIVISTSVSENNGCMDPLTIPKVAVISRQDFDGNQA